MATTIQRSPADIFAPDITRGGPPRKPPEPTVQKRLGSLDAFRGFIMLVLAANGFALQGLVKTNNPVLVWIGRHFDHVPWTGMVFWDLIQPAFMFMVGVALPFSIASRKAHGATDAQISRHVLVRSLMLILWSQVIMSISANRLHFQLINVLSQIGLTYFLCYLILQLRFRWQVASAALLLAGHTALFYLFAAPDGAFSQTANVGARLDHWIGLQYRGYYVTINFISSTVTTLAGCWTGILMMRDDSHRHRIRVLAGAAAICFVGGWAVSALAPVVKRIWTASFTFTSTGWVLLMLIAFYWLIEVRGVRKPFFPLFVVGMNSIFIYTLSIILAGWLNRAVGVFTANFWYLGQPAPVFQATAVVAVMWYMCYWLYKRRIFFKF